MSNETPVDVETLRTHVRDKYRHVAAIAFVVIRRRRAATCIPVDASTPNAPATNNRGPGGRTGASRSLRD